MMMMTMMMTMMMIIIAKILLCLTGVGGDISALVSNVNDFAKLLWPILTPGVESSPESLSCLLESTFQLAALYTPSHRPPHRQA